MQQLVRVCDRREFRFYLNSTRNSLLADRETGMQWRFADTHTRQI